MRVAVLTVGFGSGHIRATEVICRAILDGGDDYEVRSIDALEVARSWFLSLYVRPYWGMVRYAPWLWRRLFERRQRKLHKSTAPHWLFRHGCKDVLRQLRAFSPNLVVATEIAAAEIAALGRREGFFNAPILAVLTDFQAEPPWVQDEVDVYCVGSEEARSQLIGWGVSPNRVFFCGIPIDPAFTLPSDRDELLKSLGLDPHRSVVLVMAGGMGPAPLDRIVESLELCQLPIQVLAVAGRHKATRQRVEELKGKLALDLHCFGWTENLPELMAASDLLITKPGGMTVAEAVTAGLPMLLTHPIPGPEERNLRFLQTQGVAVCASHIAEIPRIAFHLLNDTRQLEAMAHRAREIARPDAAYAVAQVGRALIEKATYIELLAAPAAHAGESAYLM